MPDSDPTSAQALTAFIPLVPPSMNALMEIIWHQRKIKVKPSIRLFRSQFQSYLPSWTPQPDTLYSVDFTFFDDWYWKSGGLKRQDAPNLIKCCLDALCDRYGLDDSRVWTLTCRKFHRLERQGVQVTMSPCGSVLLREVGEASLSSFPVGGS